MRTENLKQRRSLKSKTQSIENSVIKLTRSKTMTLPESQTSSSTPTPEPVPTHKPLSRTTSLPSSFSSIERDPLPIGSDAFQAVLKEINDETPDLPPPRPQEPINNTNSEQQYQPPKLKKTSSLRRTQSERIPGRSVRFGGFEVEGIPTISPALSVRLSAKDFQI